MTTRPRQPDPELQSTVRQSWQRFLDVYEPLRPELYRYCRYLTRSPWDAEDLVQDTLGRAFVTLGCLFREPPNPRAWLFRVASNLWIDRMRGRRHERSTPAEAVVEADPRTPREAAGTLFTRLSPQERAAVVLKDVFELTLEEIAEVLSTSAGTVKSALHRGRGKLGAPETEAEAPVDTADRATLDAFCVAFNARDVDRLAALLLETSVVEIVGVVTEYGPDAARDPSTGSLPGTFSPLTRDERGGVEERHLAGYVPTPPRAEIRDYRGELVLLFFYAHADGEAVRSVARVQVESERITHLEHYFFAPEVVADVCRELGLPFRGNGYRYW